MHNIYFSELGDNETFLFALKENDEYYIYFMTPELSEH